MLAEYPALWPEISVVSQSSLHQTIIETRRVAARVATTRTAVVLLTTPIKQTMRRGQALQETQQTVSKTSQMQMAAK